MSEALVRVAAAVIERADGQVLLAQRSRGTYLGRWGFPGGHVERGETIVEAGLRELQEETGVGAEPRGVLTHLDVMDRKPDGSVSFGPDLLGSRGNVRLNDAAVDPRGRLVVGTLSLVGPVGEEVLLRISADGSVETLRTGIGLSNGIAFSPDGTLIYHVDTTAHTISARALDRDEPWRTVVTLEGAPDGLTVDSGGDLWVAQFDGGRVLRYSPLGELRVEVVVDAAQATCPGFVGPGRDILAITTAQENLDDWTDRSGAVFLADAGVTGIPDTRWPGSTTTPYWSTA